MNKIRLTVLTLLCAVAYSLGAQRMVTLQDCRDMALENNKNLKVQQEKVNMANYDKKIAWSNYFPTISAQGTYMHNEKQIQLLSDEKLNTISTVGSTLQGDVNGFIDPVIQNLMQNPLMYEIIMNRRHSLYIHELLQNFETVAVMLLLHSDFDSALQIFQDIGAYFLRKKHVPEDDLRFRFDSFWWYVKEKYPPIKK